MLLKDDDFIFSFFKESTWYKECFLWTYVPVTTNIETVNENKFFCDVYKLYRGITITPILRWCHTMMPFKQVNEITNIIKTTFKGNIYNFIVGSY